MVPWRFVFHSDKSPQPVTLSVVKSPHANVVLPCKGLFVAYALQGDRKMDLPYVNQNKLAEGLNPVPDRLPVLFAIKQGLE
jgi:hypothetical protein